MASNLKTIANGIVSRIMKSKGFPGTVTMVRCRRNKTGFSGIAHAVYNGVTVEYKVRSSRGHVTMKRVPDDEALWALVKSRKAA